MYSVASEAIVPLLVQVVSVVYSGDAGSTALGSSSCSTMDDTCEGAGVAAKDWSGVITFLLAEAEN